MIERIIQYVSIFLALLIVLPLHEFAHGFAAVKSGDVTPKLYKRYTLNPMAHFDPMGLAFFVFAGFGWAKPMPVNPSNFRNFRKGSFFVSIAGVTANFITSFLVYPLFILVSYKILPLINFNVGYFDDVLVLVLYYIYRLGLTFFVFNLIPVYPLDGFRAYSAISKRRGPFYYFLRNKGMFVLYGLFFLSIVADYSGLYYLDILGNFINIVVGYLQYPIIAFWGLLF